MIISRRFPAPLWAVLAYLLVFGIMLSLGHWQLQRAEEKVALLESAERARAAPAVTLDRIDDFAQAADAHRRVRLNGRWEATRQLLWDNRAHAGRAGFEVITPFRTAGGTLVLVNRGWVAPGLSRAREALPDVSLPDAAPDEAAVPSETTADAVVELDGLLSRPSKGFASGPALPAEGPWPRLLQYFDYAAIGAALGEPIVPALVQAQVAPDTTEFADASAPDAATLSVDDERSAPRPELLVPNWRPAASGPEKHYGYAFQWFAMAVALTVLFVVLNLRAGKKETSR